MNSSAISNINNIESPACPSAASVSNKNKITCVRNVHIQLKILESNKIVSISKYFMNEENFSIMGRLLHNLSISYSYDCLELKKHPGISDENHSNRSEYIYHDEFPVQLLKDCTGNIIKIHQQRGDVKYVHAQFEVAGPNQYADCKFYYCLQSERCNDFKDILQKVGY
ncbi:hypothetical protein ABK905_11095 [Acerihabitans sp. KWT182]|uniref:Uncharacterized protein n=1 Tax=Acerihabitans sp. KWT182 TaxID=3157919 RepID=A0AAU7QEA2_9GAMM